MGRLFCLSVFGSKSKSAKMPCLPKSVASIESKDFSVVDIPELPVKSDLHIENSANTFIHSLSVDPNGCQNEPCVRIELLSLSEGTHGSGSSGLHTDESDVECGDPLRKQADTPSQNGMLSDNYSITNYGSDGVAEIIADRKITIPDNISNMDQTEAVSFRYEGSPRDCSNPDRRHDNQNYKETITITTTTTKESAISDIHAKGVLFDDSPDSLHARIGKWIDSVDQSALAEREEDIITHRDESEPSHETLVDAMPIDTYSFDVVVRSLHATSTVGHLCGIGLREIPRLGMYSLLRTLNLSANKLERLAPGCLPRNLQSLDLSRNRITQIEGFKDLTRLRVLNLSHNKIARIGHGLASCTLLKELYLAGNRICEVEGLHRLLKLSILDLGSNKVASTKSLCQLAANYNSLLALNLLGNPVLVNHGEDQIQKLLKTLTPNVIYLNHNPTKAISFKEIVSDRVARAALAAQHRKSSTVKLSGGQLRKRSSTYQQGGYKKSEFLRGSTLTLV